MVMVQSRSDKSFSIKFTFSVSSSLEFASMSEPSSGVNFLAGRLVIMNAGQCRNPLTGAERFQHRAHGKAIIKSKNFCSS